MTRKEANMEIVRILVNAINTHADLRFNQVLAALKIINARPGDDSAPELFYEESVDTLERAKKSLKDNL